MTALAETPGPGDLAAPADRAPGQGVEQHAPQVRTLRFGPASRTVVALFEKDLAILSRSARRLASFKDDGVELFRQAGGLQSELPVVVVDVEHPALCPRIRGGFGFIDLDGKAVDVQNTG